MAHVQSTLAINQREKRGSVTYMYSTDREYEVSKIFIIFLRLIGRTVKETFKVSGLYVVKYGPQN